MRAWVGGYTADMDGYAAGIGVLLAGAAEQQAASGPLAFAGTAVATSSPSWLVAHPTLDVVYAALEGDGQVRAFRRTGPATLAALGEPRAVGTLTCHAAVSPDGRWLAATGFGDGTVARMPLDADGVPGMAEVGAAAHDPYRVGGSAAPLPDLSRSDAEVAALAALRAAAGPEFAHLLPQPDPQPERDEPGRESHAHHARFLPDGLVATTDLGFDLVRIWRDGRIVQEVTLPYGSGPRHSVWHPSGHLYVNTEFSNEVFALAPDATGTWRIVTAAPISREATAGADAAAELSLSADKTHLYAGIRGINALGVLAVQGAGDRLAPAATVEAHVDWPRHHVLVGDTLLVAGQRSDEIASLAIDARTQIPNRRRASARVPTPSMILPVFD